MPIQIIRLTAERLSRRKEDSENLIARLAAFFSNVKPTIRPKDYRVLSNIIEDYSQQEVIRSSINSRNGFMIAMERGHILGVRAFAPTSQDTLESIFTIVPISNQRRGVGTRLHRATLSYARTHGFSRLYLTAISSSGKKYLSRIRANPEKYRYTSQGKVPADRTYIARIGSEGQYLKAGIHLFPSPPKIERITIESRFARWKKTLRHFLRFRRNAY